MKKVGTVLLTGLFLFLFAGGAGAAISYDANVTPGVIFGSGNGNGYFVVDTNDNIEVGIRAKLRKQGIYNSDGAGTYSFDKGQYTYTEPHLPIAMWNYEFAVNVDRDGSSGKTFSSFDVYLSIDIDPSQGQNWVTFSPFDAWTDNSLGDNTTTDATDITDGNYEAYSVAQNSQNMSWTFPALFDYDVDGTYDFKLYVTEKDHCEILAQTFMTVKIGDGGCPVPVPAAIWLLGSGLLGLIGMKRRNKSRAA